MPFHDISLSQSEQEFKSIGEWAKRLSIPARTLLHHGSQGDLGMFAVPPREVDYYSVHEDFIGDPTSAPLPYEAQPISMPEPDVMGLVLSNDDCAQLASGKTIRKSLFDAVIRKAIVWSEVVEPIRGRLGSKLRPDGWRIAAYQKIASTDQGEWNAHSPVSVSISPTNVYIRDVDIDHFRTKVTSYQFINDIFSSGHIIEELPVYISGKLREAIDANRLFWRNHNAIDATEKERRRTEALKHLREELPQLCDKTMNAKTLAAFAADVCDPTKVPRSKQIDSTSVTPAMLALVTAAKLYWSAHCTTSPTPDTYPDRDAIANLLRYMGLRETNAASSGATLIRPEIVRSPGPKPDRPATIFRRRQPLRR